MTNTVAMSGNDVVTINGRILNDLATGDVASISFPNNIAAVKTGKNGNSIYSFNATGKQSEVKLRIIRGSADDKFLTNLLNLQQNNFEQTVLMTGEFVKKIGNGLGQVASDTYLMSGGIFVKYPDAKSNVEGDDSQSVAEYTIHYSNSPRVIT